MFEKAIGIRDEVRSRLEEFADNFKWILRELFRPWPNTEAEAAVLGKKAVEYMQHSVNVARATAQQEERRQTMHATVTALIAGERARAKELFLSLPPMLRYRLALMEQVLPNTQDALSAYASVTPEMQFELLANKVEGRAREGKKPDPN